MFISEEVDVSEEYKIGIHALREEWQMGVGRYFHDPVTDKGASWTYKNDKDTANTWQDAGGYFYSASKGATVQTFSNVAGDIEVDITDMVENWHTGTIANNGILLKRSGSQETDSIQYGSLAYFSRETNTIYSPRIEAR